MADMSKVKLPDNSIYNLRDDRFIYEKSVSASNVATFSDGADNVPLKSLILDINYTQSGSGDPFPPGGSKNICPPMTAYNANGLITTVDSDGKINVSGTATGTAGYITNYVNLGKIIPSETAFSISVTNAPPSTLRAFFDTGVKDIPAGATKAENTTRGIDITKVRLYLFTTEGQSYNFSFYFQLEIGASATPYVPYGYENFRPITGVSSDTISVADGDNVVQKTYTVQLGDTYYGATLDVTNGKLRATKTAKKFNDITNIQPYSGYTGYFVIEPVNDKAVYNANIISEIYKTIPVTTSIGDMPDYSIRGVNNESSPYINRFFVRDSRYTTTTQFLEGVGNTLLCYDLRDPIDIDLTPMQINSLLGQNNIWHDGNGTTACTYRVDTPLVYAIKDISPEVTIDDSKTVIDQTWSSSKIASEISTATADVIDDTTTDTDTTWSSNKIASEISTAINNIDTVLGFWIDDNGCLCQG